MKDGKKKPSLEDYDANMQQLIRQEIKRQERFRKRVVFICSLIACACFAYFIGYYYFLQRTESTYKNWSDLIGTQTAEVISDVKVNRTQENGELEILEKYKTLYNRNKSLIGWLKIDDTIIDYPVMQTTNNDYYLDHNLNQEYDKNGSIFMDKDCDAAKPSTNLIIYGHHMKSGKMFGSLELYSSKSYYEKHPYIQFDTIYEEGTYQVMYVFRSKIYNEDEIVFKYYQFIDVNSYDEFASNMDEMAKLSLYDTGVTASYGDKLITLSTCDNFTEDGRFVVVAKKID